MAGPASRRILIRSTKSPYRVVSADETFQRNLVAENSGNLIFLGAAWKVLETPGTKLSPDRLRTNAALAPVINERFDAYVVPLANAFRPSFAPRLERMTRLIERLRIPVVVLGVGAQGSIDGDFSELEPIASTVRRFVAAVLDRSPAIGVRGELTAAYLGNLGFRDVEVIGCPSMFLDGDRLSIAKRAPTLDPNDPIVVTMSPNTPAIGPIVDRHLGRYPRLTYVAQDLATLGLLRGHDVDAKPEHSGGLPLDRRHDLFRERRVRYYVDPWPWIRDLSSARFVFGTRIHGAIAGLLAGTPAVVLAHDSRTLELARYFGIPHRRLSELGPETDAAELYAAADFGDLVAGHQERFARFAGFLARCGLDHAFAHDGGARFDERVRRTAYPPAVTVTTDILAPDRVDVRVRRWASQALRPAWASTGRA